MIRPQAQVVKKTVEIPAHSQDSERSVFTQKETPIIKKIQIIQMIQKTVDVLQVQFFDDVVDTVAVMHDSCL